MKRGTESNLVIGEFKLASSFCRTKQRRGGSCILIKQHLKFKIIKPIEPVHYAFEYCGIEILDYNLIVVCIYRRPEYNNINLFFENISLLLDILTKKKE